MDAGTVYLIAGTVTFAFTTVLTVAGVGAAFILIPVFLYLGIGLHTAMATALLLNALAMFFACLRFVPAGMVKVWVDVSLPPDARVTFLLKPIVRSLMVQDRSRSPASVGVLLSSLMV